MPPFLQENLDLTVQALGKVGGVRAVEALKAALANSDFLASNTAQEVLNRIDPNWMNE
jgi:hypothetical protein